MERMSPLLALLLYACGSPTERTEPIADSAPIQADAGTEEGSVCVPTTCPDGLCGVISDGCGGEAVCPTTCQTPLRCGGGGVRNVCGCIMSDLDVLCARTDCGFAVDPGCGVLVLCSLGDVESCSQCRPVTTSCEDGFRAYACEGGVLPLGCLEVSKWDQDSTLWCCQVF